ncbi:FecR domain-containing protein [Pedobacter sp. KR3-3]|uniref:FecR domain-containing protein n=1 Tax=Pedobacter albus TaxID=3113905 RepID=A0ABU7I8X8_9SPHI|nr:FecR domain-containing protein [Pedobacter sp. KR3-3]MEE1945829.1 FecR domain-containing protein [Pedobacter sp. KR3-3]
MNIEKEELLRLLKKYRAGQTSPAEEEFLEAYYHLFEHSDDGLEKLDAAAKEALKQNIRAGLDQKITLQQKSFWLRNYRSIAAVAFLILVGSYLLLTQLPKHESFSKTTQISKTYDIAPGSNKAILTLANGQSIALKNEKDEKLIYQWLDSGATTTVAYNTITTPRGGQFQLTLPDGSRVWLNAASSISFPTAFTGKERRVETTGEVYFEVAKEHLPFIVSTAGQEVEVLGTHFNINAYADEGQIKTTLLEGSVRIAASADHKTRLLKPGQQAVFMPSGQFVAIQEADTEMAVAWKNGFFKFDKQNIQSVMRQISRWYDIEVVYQGNLPDDEYVGKIKRSANVSGVLNILRLSKLNFKVEERKIIVYN